MKYTIELTNKQKAQMDCMIDIVHRYVGFNPKLEPIKTTNVEDTTYDVAYNEALKDADHAIDVLKSMTGTERAEWFEDCVGVDEVVCGFTVQRIVEITKAYEEKKKVEDEIKEGDIVRFNEKSHVYNIQKDREFLVLHVFKDRNLATILYDNGDTSCIELSLVDKTNRHIDEVSQLLNKLRGEEDEKN